jgi:hypothetical protein
MKIVREHIKARQARFAKNSFFEQLEIDEASPEALSFVSGLTFFVMVFQDVLRLNEARVKDPALRDIARHHRAEDRGHDDWFLHDLAAIEGRLPDVSMLFSSAHVTTRDAAYALIGEVLRADDDRVNIALLLVLESTGHVFFEKVVSWLERAGLSDGLRYFARSHLGVELGHEMFEQKANAMLDAIELREDERRAVIAAVDRCFDPITEMIVALRDVASVPPPSYGAPPVSVTVPRAAGLPSLGARKLRQVG